MRTRLEQIVWIKNYLPDLESDFSVFHRVDDMYSLPAAVFVSRAERMYAYKGALRMRAKMEAQEEHPSPSSGGRSSANARRGDEPVEMTPAALQVWAETPLFEMAKVA